MSVLTLSNHRSVWNVSCFNPKLHLDPNHLDSDALLLTIRVCKALILLVIALATIGFNSLMVLVLQNKSYNHYVHFQPRYFLVALCYNSILTCSTIIVFSLFPTIYLCWPFGEVVCVVQAIFQASFEQHYCFLIISMTIDRFWSLNNQTQYIKWSSKKLVLTSIILSWCCSFGWYCLIVLPSKMFFVDFDSGIHMCKPVYNATMMMGLFSCIHYFTPTLVLMYCYGNIFHDRNMGKKHRHVIISNEGNSSSMASISTENNSVTLISRQEMPRGLESNASELVFKNVFATPNRSHNNIDHVDQEDLKPAFNQMLLSERHHHYSMARVMSAIALNFVLMITPLTVKDVFVSGTETQIDSNLDYTITLFGLLFHLINPLIYWIFNGQFRKSLKEFVNMEILCQRPARSSCCDGHHHNLGLNGHPHRHDRHPQFGVGVLVDQIRPIALATTPGSFTMSGFASLPHNSSAKLRSHQNGFLPSSPLSVLTANQIKRPLRSSRQGLSNDRYSSPNFDTLQNYQTITRAISMPKVKMVRDDDGERHWGEILEKSISQMSLQRFPDDLKHNH